MCFGTGSSRAAGVYSEASLEKVMSTISGDSSTQCEAVSERLQECLQSLRDDEEYLDDPTARFKYLKLLLHDIKTKCDKKIFKRLKKKRLLPKEDEMERVVGILIPMMESYNLTLKDLPQKLDHAELIMMANIVLDLDAEENIKLKYNTMLLENVVPAPDFNQQEKEDLENALEANIEAFVDVEFKRLCVAYDRTTGTKRCLRRFGLYENLDIEVFSEDPWVALHHNFLTKAELKEANAEIQDFEFGQATIQIQKEGEKDEIDEEDDDTVNFRDQIDIYEDESPFFDNVKARIERAGNFHEDKDVNTIEIYKYRLGGAHTPHKDFSTDGNMARDPGGRVAIAMIFLRKTKRGGGFAMPRLGIYIAPTPGALLIWRNDNKDGWNSQESVHGGCPVYQGTKMIAITEFCSLGQRDVCPMR